MNSFHFEGGILEVHSSLECLEFSDIGEKAYIFISAPFPQLFFVPTTRPIFRKDCQGDPICEIVRRQHLDHDTSRWVEYILLPPPAIHRLLKLGRKDSPSEREMILLLLLTYYTKTQSF